MSVHALLHRIESSLIAATSASRTVIDRGPFRLMLSPDDELVYLNYAVPTRAGFMHDDVTAMITAFREHGRVPRLEFTRELWPDLPSLLEEQGVKLEAEQPTMICTAEDLRVQYSPDVELIMLSADDDLQPMLQAVNEAFGMAGLASEDQISTNRAQIKSGVQKCAAALVDGAIAGGAFVISSAGVGELAGVGTRPTFRRRGVASSVSSFLLEDHFRNNDLAWLSAGDETSRAVYERLGFYTVATHVNYFMGA